MRGYFGKVLFDHQKETLSLKVGLHFHQQVKVLNTPKVRTDDQIRTQGIRDKDPKSLSGGEKSFSTICLLLSLWEAIGCPLRCLG
jgi:structural maintenance of chromosomes protein 6